MKKKIILALLASVCVAASAAGIAACTSKNNGPTHDPALYAAYQAYRESADNPMSYEAWLAYILDQFYAGGDKGAQGDTGDAGDSIESVNILTISEKQYYEFTFTSGKIIRLAMDGSDRQETTAFIIKAVDTNGTPLADAYFNIGYYDAGTGGDKFLTSTGATTSNVSSAYALKSDDKGIARFNTFLSSQTQQSYSAFIADPSSFGTHDRNGVPDGYAVSFGYDEALGMAKNNAPFTKDDDFSYSTTVHFRIDNSWGTLYDESNDLHYNRYVAEGSDEITEDYTPYVKSATKGKYNYFTLMPFPYHLINEIDTAKSYKAAEGVYRVTWTASVANAGVELYLYDFYGTPQTVKSNADGSPADSHVKMHSGNVPTDQSLLEQRYQAYTRNDGMLNYNAWLEDYAKTFSGSNYVDVEITEDFTGINSCLAYIADTDCEVTITVKRIGDAAKWTTNSVTVQMPSGATKAQDNDGRVMLVPLDSAIYKDNNGYYHVDSPTGPMIYVQLKNATRINSYSMVYLAHYKIETDGEADPYRTIFNFYSEEFNEATNSGVRTFTDYSNVVLGYGELANKDGLYPVNDLLKTILEEYCRGYSDSDNYWVAACSYYGLVPAGTEEAPYEVKTGSNTINLNNGSAYVYFNTNTTGYYGFYSTNGTIEGIEGGVLVQGVVTDGIPYGVFYVEVTALNDFVFKVTASGETAIVMVGGFDNSHTVMYDDSSADLEHAAHGTAGNPIAVKTGVLQVTVDLDKYDEYIEVNLTAFAGFGGNYTISLFGSDTATIVDSDGNNLIGQTISLTSSTPFRIRIKDIASGTFFINVQQIQ